MLRELLDVIDVVREIFSGVGERLICVGRRTATVIASDELGRERGTP